MARYGEPAVEVAASVLVCENCHGEDGLGRAEGGIEPTDISWEALTKPYGSRTADGRRRPPYTEETVRRAITLGFDSGGATLGPGMPRYQLSRDDLDDLVSHIKKLGTVPDPGIAEDTLWVGTIVAPRSSTSPLSTSDPVRDALTSYFDRINEQGGVYGRRLKLRSIEATARPEDRARAFRALLEGEPIFAVVSPFALGMEGELEREAESHKIPVLGPLVFNPQITASGCRYVFYLDAGLDGQARALVRFATEARERPFPSAAILGLDNPKMRSVFDAVRDECRRAGWEEWPEFRFRPDDADLDRVTARLAHDGVSVVMTLGLGDRTGRLVEAAGALGWAPELLVPGSLVGPSVFDAHPTFRGRVVVALPSLPTDQGPEGLEEYRDLSARGSLSPRDRGAHWPALASARLLVEGLRHSGRNTSRERLITVLESLHDFRTNYAPPLTFGPLRRVGAWGAHLVAVDPVTGRPRAIGDWQDAAPR
jgi:ABC-type branched-subunit amino acid transport system substrate-binding protein